MSRKLMLLAILAVVGTAELLVMTVLDYLGIRAGWLENLVDMAVLVAISAPLLHHLLLRSERAVREGKELARAYQSLKGLYGVADALKQATTEQDVLNNTLQQVMKFPGVQAGWVSLREGETGFRLAAACGLPPALEVSGAFEGECCCRRKLLAGELDQITNILECERLQQAKGDTRGLRFHASIPLWIGNRVIGVMNLAGLEQGQVRDEDLEILYGVGNQVAVALERTHLLQQMEQKVEERTAALTAEIAERQRAEVTLRESEERYRSLFESMRNGIAHCRMVFVDGQPRDFIYVAVNRAFETLTGLKNVAGKRVSEVIPNIRESDRGLFEIYSRVTQTGVPEEFEYYLESLKMWFAISVYRCGQDQFVAIFETITERKRAEEILRQSEKQFRLLFYDSPLPMWVCDLETLRFLEVNDAAIAHYGYSREEFLAMSIAHIRLPEQATSLTAMIEQIRADGKHHIHCMQSLKKGGIIEVEVYWQALEFGGRQAVLAVAQDITERKQLELQLSQSQKMEAVGRLAGGVAHDFNNHLGIIIGYSELLLERLGANDPLRKNAGMIKEAGLRSASLTRQLLAFSRRQVFEPRILDLNEVVSELEKMLRPLIGEDIELATSLDPVLGKVRGDSTQMEQVIMNLAVNARDAMPQGGRLTIETANVELDEAYAKAHVPANAGPYVMLAVSDTGIGMDNETQLHIFEPFFTTKEKGKGTGLGLATVYGIVKQSGGWIWVYSEPGHGTTFKIYLPRVEGGIREAEAERASPVALKGEETVLVVEDEGMLRELACEFLQSSGYTVLEAANGAEAIEMSNQHQGPIHLLMTDAVMPGMSGRELAQRLVGARPEMKVLYVSGYTDDVVLRNGLLEPDRAFLQKPFTKDALTNKVRAVLEGGKGATDDS